MSSDIQNTSLSTPQPDQTAMVPGTKHVILSISLVLIQLLAIFGNTMLFLVVYRKPHLRTRTNMFILNLACADLGVAILCMPFSVITCVRQSWIFGDALCQFNGFVNITFAMCSLLTLTAISIEKYFTIVKPLNQVITGRRALLMLAVTWLEPLMFASMPLTGLTRYEYKEGSSQCSVQNPVSRGQTIHAGLVFLVAYVIPLSIMGFAYVKIFQTARVHHRRVSRTSVTSRVSTSTMTNQNQIALTIFIMLMVFILCWTPYFVYVAYITAKHVTVNQTRDLATTAYWCAFTNSAFNPFIYGIRNPHFRSAFKEILSSVSRPFCRLFGNAKKRGYSESSTTTTKPSQVSRNNSGVKPESSCHSNGSQTLCGLAMCSSQILCTENETKPEDLENGRKSHKGNNFPEDSELREKKSSDCKVGNYSLENQCHLNLAFEHNKEKDIPLVNCSYSDECPRTFREHGLSSEQCIPRPYTYPQTKLREDSQTPFKMATRMRCRKRYAHALRKSTGRILQTRDWNINDHVIGSDFGSCYGQPSRKISPSKENRRRRKLRWRETYL